MREQNRGTYWDQSEKWDSVCLRGVRGSSSQGWMRTYGGERVQILMARVKRGLYARTAMVLRYMLRKIHEKNDSTYLPPPRLQGSREEASPCIERAKLDMLFAQLTRRHTHIRPYPCHSKQQRLLAQAARTCQSKLLTVEAWRDVPSPLHLSRGIA